MSECYIYVIGQAEGPVKIGISAKPAKRLSSVQTGCPFKIGLLHARLCSSRGDAHTREQIFHLIWGNLRLEGEWFDIPANIAIESIEFTAGKLAGEIPPFAVFNPVPAGVA